MNSIDLLHCEIGTVSSRQDGSVAFRVISPELRPSEAGAIMAFHGKAARVCIFPTEGESETIEVKTERDKKTQAQRIRGVLFKLWEKDGKPGVFDHYYESRTEKIIEHLKKQLE